jgi:dienelactone hydrolase
MTSVLSGCALWFGKPPAPVPEQGLAASDAHMAKFGFSVLRDGTNGSPRAFDRIQRVYVKGSGPRVIVLHELPGLRDGDIEVGVALSSTFEVYMPLLFGTAGQDEAGLGTRQACRTGLFKCNDRNTRHPVTTDLLAMTNQVCGSNPCGIIGMCLTGTLPLSLMEAQGVVALVMAQPTLPIVWHIWPFAGLDISKEDTTKAMAVAIERKASIYMLRYRGDLISGRTAFNRLVDRISPAKEKLSFFEVTQVPGRSHSTLVHNSKHPDVAKEQVQAVVRALNARLRSTQ